MNQKCICLKLHRKTSVDSMGTHEGTAVYAEKIDKWR